MELVLPESEGWAGMHLMNAEWGNIGVIAKRTYAVSGNTATEAPAEDIVITDTLEPAAQDGEDNPVIRREAETALFKSHGDVLYLGRGTEALDSDNALIDEATITVNGQERRRYARGGPVSVDPVNLFGYEPRTKRISGGYDPDTFDFATDGAALFRSARRSIGYSVPVSSKLPSGTLDVTVTTQSPGATDTLADFVIMLPAVQATAFVWEGGRNDPPNWCKRSAIALEADTMTISGATVTVVWRGKLSLSAVPIADLRRLTLREVA